MLEKLINYWKFTKLAFVHSHFQFFFGCFLFKNVENYVSLPISSNCVAFSEWIFETRVISNQYQSINIKWSSGDEFTRNKKPLQTQVHLIWHLCPQIMCFWEIRLFIPRNSCNWILKEPPTPINCTGMFQWIKHQFDKYIMYIKQIIFNLMFMFMTH